MHGRQRPVQRCGHGRRRQRFPGPVASELHWPGVGRIVQCFDRLGRRQPDRPPSASIPARQASPTRCRRYAANGNLPHHLDGDRRGEQFCVEFQSRRLDVTYSNSAPSNLTLSLDQSTVSAGSGEPNLSGTSPTRSRTSRTSLPSIGATAPRHAGHYDRRSRRRPNDLYRPAELHHLCRGGHYTINRHRRRHGRQHDGKYFGNGNSGAGGSDGRRDHAGASEFVGNRSRPLGSPAAADRPAT